MFGTQMNAIYMHFVLYIVPLTSLHPNSINLDRDDSQTPDAIANLQDP
jgi:hypothetical protein